MHKLAIVLAASRRDETVITLADLRLAEIMLNTTEESAHKVFSKVGRSEEALQAARLLDVIATRKVIPYKELYRLSQVYFPNSKEFEGILTSFRNAGQIVLDFQDGQPVVKHVPDQA
jgi:hypothetical protein